MRLDVIWTTDDYIILAHDYEYQIYPRATMYTSYCEKEPLIWCKLFLEALFTPILMIPITLWRLIMAAWDIDDEDAKKEANR